MDREAWRAVIHVVVKSRTRLSNWTELNPHLNMRLRTRREGATEIEMVGCHHRINEHEFEKTPGDSEGQGSLACCSP